MRGVDLLLAARQPPVAPGVRVEPTPPLRHPHRRAAALIGGVGDRGDPGGVERVDDPVLAGGAHVVARAGQRRRTQINRPAGSASTCTIQAVDLVFPE
jgi:hypothetical protein